MRILWSPWRYQYVKSAIGGSNECLFCKIKDQNDEDAYIVYRGEFNFVVLNAFPYNSGHLMIAPYRHVDSLEKLDDRELLEMVHLINDSIRALRKALNPDGFNIGVNIGRSAGAGVPGHVHVHVVPRWTGDSNFMPVIADTKVLPVALSEVYKLLKENWPRKY
ncbi:HIT family protein [Thermogladius sp. 4427co]|uniref:HIT family protein n=1 Tax=Thermogladius sp. 4427co TaxID=3450718 RepID=UPI003F7A234A